MPRPFVRSLSLIVLAALACAAGSHAAPLDRATIAEVVNRVSIIDPATRKARPAKQLEIFVAPEVMRTGADSRAELVANDKTVTRVGSNTVFSFEPRSRVIELQ